MFGQENLSNNYAVDAGGQIAFPLIGAVAVRNRTIRAVEETIEAGLRGKHLREPQVTVEVDAYLRGGAVGASRQSRGTA